MTVQTTSLFAYQNFVLPKVGTNCRIVYEAMKTRTDWTQKEMKEYLGWEINEVTPRFTDLMDAGLIEKVKDKKRWNGKMNVNVYAVKK